MRKLLCRLLCLLGLKKEKCSACPSACSQKVVELPLPKKAATKQPKPAKVSKLKNTKKKK